MAVKSLDSGHVLGSHLDSATFQLSDLGQMSQLLTC